jgi:PAS domain S-box-containing protein
MLDRAALPRRESEARRAAILEAALDCVITIDHEGRILEFNPAAEATFGHKRDKVLGREMASVIIPPGLRERHRQGLARCLATGEGAILGRRLEMTALRADGTEFPVELTVTRIAIEGPPLFSGYVRDITERKRAAEMLREGEERFRNAFDEASIGMSLQGLDGQFLRVNRALCEMVGYTEPELLARTYRDITHPEDRGAEIASDRQLLAGEIRSYGREKRYVHKLGRVVWVLLSVSLVRSRDAAPAYFIAQCQNITTRKEAEESRARLEHELRQSHKMEAIGRLAGGVAHDFNNLLTVILGRAQMLLHHMEPGSRLYRNVNLIAGTAERAAALTQRLLAFSRQQMLQPRVLNLNAVVTGIEKMLRRLLGEDIELVTALASDLSTVKADPGQLEQIIMNLAVNARDAMPQGGRLILETANADLDDEYAREHPSVLPGRYVMLAVSDTGIGMDEETRSRVFEPFFTTKDPGKGTGLGLATVFGIVKQSGGNICVYSEPGHGTTFKVYLPQAAAVPVEAIGLSQSPETVVGGSESILLVEDEDSLRELARESLEAAGYTVLEARHGAEALVVSEQHPGPIHLLVTDVIMPHMNGRELTDRMVRVRPDLRVLYMSGYTGEVIREQDLVRPGTAFLPKPFSPDALVRKAREVLDLRPAG